MKTLFLCLGIVMGALLVGMRQQTRVADLERKLVDNSSQAPAREPDKNPGDAEIAHTGKSRVRPVPPTAAEVYRTVVGLLETHGRGVSNSPSSVMDNREAFAAIMKLDLVGQKDLIALIRDSSDPKFSDVGYKHELFNVCLCAMADRHPDAALEILEHADDEIGRFYYKRMGPESMFAYLLGRLCDQDPFSGVTALVRVMNNDKDSWNGSTIAEMVSSVADRDPDLALETITKLPESLQQESWRMISDQAGTDEECRRVFEHLRENPMSDSGEMNGVQRALFTNVRKRAETWKGFEDWLDGMHLSHEEKWGLAPVLESAAGWGEEHHVARWLLETLPESQERDYLVWRTTTGFWQASDPVAVSDLLQQQGINPEEMMKLNQEGYLRPSQ